MLSWGEKTDSAVDTLLRLSDNQPQSTCSSLVQLIAIAYKLVEETNEGVLGTKTEKEIGLHWLHCMTVKAIVPSEIDEEELRTVMDNVDSNPNKVAVMSTKLMCIPQFTWIDIVPTALAKLAICYPEYEEYLFNCIDHLTQDENAYFACQACARMFSLLERLPQRAERVMNRLQESLHRFKCLELLQMRESVSLDFLLKTYMMTGNDLLVFFIAWKLFDTPITMETMRNGKSELIVQTTSNSKKKYKFQTVEEAQAFASSFDECIEVVFPDVASLVPKLDSDWRQRSNNPLFANLRDRLTTSFW